MPEDTTEPNRTGPNAPPGSAPSLMVCDSEAAAVTAPAVAADEDGVLRVVPVSQVIPAKRRAMKDKAGSATDVSVATNGTANGRSSNGTSNGNGTTTAAAVDDSSAAHIASIKNGINNRLQNGNAYRGEITLDGKDPMCDADNPVRLQFEDVTSAAFKIKGGILSTPCMLSHLSALTGMEVYLKQDFLQFTGSFKERGARYALMELPASQKERGVISASLGNHALALSYHGKLLGVPVTVVMPIVAPMMKIQSCRQHGATVVVQGQDMAEAKALAMRMARDQHLAYINGYDHPHIMAGQGTLGLEILEQVPDVDAIVVPVGGAGLIAGIATAVKSMRPNVKIIGVESERCASFSAALQAGKPVPVSGGPTIADGLAVPTVGYNAFVTAAPLVDRMVVVKEETVAVSILRLVELEKCVVEGAAACGLAAILDGQLDEFKGKKLVLLLCGGNIDTTVLGRCLERGLAVDGRLIKFSVTVSDRPGGIAELCAQLARFGVSIKDIEHERAWIASDVFSVSVTVTCETRDMDHANELKEHLNKNYTHTVFPEMR